MANPEGPDEILAKQGSTVDAEQNMRLNFAADPVFAHLATLSTAAALGGVEWGVQKRQLRAMIHKPGRRGRRANNSIRDYIAGSQELSHGVTLGGQINFSASPLEAARVFPTFISESLTYSLEYKRRELESSAIVLQRESLIYGAPTLQVGISAIHGTHTKLYKPRIEVVNEAPADPDLQALLDLLQTTTEEIKPANETGSLLTRTRSNIAVTTLPTAHFAFHEALGVAAQTMAVARQNFSVLAECMELPYTLPEPA